MAQKVETQLTAKDRTKVAFKSVTRGLNRLRKSIFSLKGAFVGAVGIGGIGLFIKSTLLSIDTNKKMADSLGLTTHQLGGFEYGAALAGESLETVQKGLLKLDFNLGQASQGIGQAKYALKTLNLSFKDLNKLQPNERFLAIADAIGNLKTRQEQATIAGELLGKAGLKLMLLFDGGSEAIRGFQEKAELLGISLSRTQSAEVEKFVDMFHTLKVVLQGVGNILVVALVPFMEAFLAVSLETLEAWVKDGGPARLAEDMSEAIRKALTFLVSFTVFLSTATETSLMLLNNFKELTAIDIGKWVLNLLNPMSLLGKGMLWEGPLTPTGDQEKTFEEKLKSFLKMVEDATGKSLSLLNETFVGMGQKVNDLGVDTKKPLEALTKSFETVKNTALVGFGNAFGTTMEQVVAGTKKMSDAFKDLGKVILNSLIKMFVAQAFVNPLAKGLGFLASGGHAQGGSPYIVGERGPELFVPSGSGTVIPNNKLGSGGVTIQQNINFATGIQASVRSEVLQLLPAIAQVSKGAVQDAQLRR